MDKLVGSNPVALVFLFPFIDEGTETQGLNDVPVGLTAEVWTAEPSPVLSFG